MAKLTISGKKKNGIVKLKIVVEKLQKSLLLAKKPPSNTDDFERVTDSIVVPKDVKEGHFAVIAVDDDELKRFIVPLTYLTHPSFLRVLEQAAEEYGFDHNGALTVPCRPSELERILSERWGEDRGSRIGVNLGSSKTLVKGCLHLDFANRIMSSWHFIKYKALRWVSDFKFIDSVAILSF